MQSGKPLGIIERDEEGVGEIRSRRDRGGIGHNMVTNSCHADISRRKSLNDPEDLLTQSLVSVASNTKAPPPT